MSTQAVPGQNATAEEPPKFTFEEQVLAYSSLYGMALLCVVWGSYRSLAFIRRTVNKRRPIEASISGAQAMRFPLTASLVLFGLYVVFKGPHEVSTQLIAKAEPLVPPHVLLPLEKVRDFFQKTNETVEKPSFAQKWLKTARDSHPLVEQGYTSYVEPYAEYAPNLNKQNLVFLLLLLLCYEGCSALAVILQPAFAWFLRLLPIGDRWPRKSTSYLLSLKKGKKSMEAGDIVDAGKDETEYIFYIDYDSHYLIAFLFTMWVGISHLYRRHWITNNLLGVAFSIYGIENLHLASFKAGLVLLCGLFFYDIFWVFGTDVMTTVAKTIDAPILLQFPQDLLRVGWLDASKHGMLGLGDIVIPGIFIALLYRFDHYIGSKKPANQQTKSRFYFVTVVIGYMLGLLVTMAVMHWFKSAQPALLYLVPACIIIPLFLALVRGEFKELWNYSEEHLVDPHGEQEKAKEKAKEQKKVDEKKTAKNTASKKNN
ncbi:Peptidase A22B domain containing protein, protein [Aphelenchoides fujianensis]|nr:Peptidase A22B domain containing protein, protein [Aphelenchoides fujianensis]